jgi:protein-disulfide isomerase/uncharacterized membrane protein
MSMAVFEQPVGRSLRIAFLVLCTIGACFSADLLRLHVKVHTDPDYHSYCAISEALDCETVAQSAYAVFVGLPVALWALLGYLGMGALAIWGLRARLPTRSWPFGLLFWLAASSLAVSVVLGLVSIVLIGSACIVCAGIYLINAALLIVAGLELRKLEEGPLTSFLADARAMAANRGAVVYAGLVVAAVMGLLWLTVPRYWELKFPAGPGGLAVGQTPEGSPWIGASRPTLEIVLFSDYQCPFCQRGQDAIRNLISEFPEKVRLVHRHYPLDPECNASLRQAFHPYACAYAKLAHCAAEQGRFWEANDFLYRHGRRLGAVNAGELARAVGIDVARLRDCLEDPSTQLFIEREVAAGRKLKVRATPTFVIDGRTYRGRIPPEIIQRGLGVAERAD